MVDIIGGCLISEPRQCISSAGLTKCMPRAQLLQLYCPPTHLPNLFPAAGTIASVTTGEPDSLPHTANVTAAYGHEPG
jgi:hypothetical protein